jgi:hypothetical protein
MWILTTTYNTYNQEGDYFITAWLNKPSREEIAKTCGIDISGKYTNSDSRIDYILNGGGPPSGNWYSYYNLFSIEEGQL